MESLLFLLFGFLLIQRLGELVIANSNKRWMMDRGGKESGQEHYILFIILHTCFFLSILIEFMSTGFEWSLLSWFALGSFFILQLLRVWCIATLGRRWNTRIIILPDEEPIKKGLYRLIRHPNYVIVFFELAVIPILFHAYVTALIFPLLHLLVLKVRIPAEERALEERT
ncbi:hypothetical protein LCM20_07335 [Halobacillus litoralis]|uniref:isoprenylcysteine carboxyl methyltransferase family protein n=1 Tax=Halobacillus litoralis TaxID=45668 RepID=UPI001CD5D924|nr:isoprenylcysteine carboxylmethyltransferase family protein [Halobacillus litoralis]MCA0970397.1 hypothetical protein [Halobacillus litoralis]